MKIMKNFISSVLFLFLTSTAMAQNKNVIKVNLLSPAVYSYGIAYEQVIRWDWSLDINASYTPSKLTTSNYYDGYQEISGYAAGIALRKYTALDAPDGYYFGPYLRYQNISVSDAFTKGKLTVMSAGIKTGYQFIINEIFSIDVYTGSGIGMYKISASETFDEVTEIIGTGSVVNAAVTFGFHLGYVF